MGIIAINARERDNCCYRRFVDTEGWAAGLVAVAIAGVLRVVEVGATDHQSTRVKKKIAHLPGVLGMLASWLS